MPSDSIVRLAPVAMRLHRPKKSLTCTDVVVTTRGSRNETDAYSAAAAPPKGWQRLLSMPILGFCCSYKRVKGRSHLGCCCSSTAGHR